MRLSFVGMGSVISNYIKIGNYVKIGIGSVVTQNISDNTSYIGTLVRIVKNLNLL